jgi:catechol 2,3-dioxygenase-like lactoylglutathione lyase family enzyme
MPTGVLQHFTVEPADLERSKDFYCDVLGLAAGFRPDLGYPGYWLYSGDVATVHLLGRRAPGEGITSRDPNERLGHTGRVDHIAFGASDLNRMRQNIKNRKVQYREVLIKDGGLVQLLFKDPDGVDLELNFPISELEV